MVTTRTAVAAIGAAAAIALALSACSSSPGSEPGAELDPDRAVELDFAWWGDATRGALYEEAIAVFNEEYPNITIRQQFQSWADYWTARNTEAAGSSLPDVLAVDAGHAVMYGQQGQLLDLTTQIGVNLDVSEVQESLLQSAAVGEAQYGVPIGTNSLGLLYNTALLDEFGIAPPEEGYTWEDYADFVSEISAAGAAQDPPVYGSADFTGNMQMFSLWLTQQDIAPYRDNEIAYTREHVIEFLRLGEQLRGEGVFTPQETLAQLQVPAFNVGVEAATINWASSLGGAITDLGSDDIGLMLPPSGPQGPHMSSGISIALAASANTTEPDAAAIFIDFLINSPEVGEIFGTTRGVPATASQRDGVVVEEGSVDARVLDYAATVEAVATGTPAEEFESFSSIEAEWIRLGQELQYGNITIEEFADTYFTYVDTL
ncbi:ABC transporter substrate-binding protein [Pseudactinotalea sp.]|uniref:ABC transporter substrate-binding protein n=1 Tax=Pseudactinotalea sp. TaxID=1926260 RepID=UPI003B3A66DF